MKIPHKQEGHGWSKDCSVYHCSDGEHTSWWVAIASTRQWKEWREHADMLYDIAECEECGWMSKEHAQAFLDYVEGRRTDIR
jgi:hypothetical protein